MSNLVAAVVPPQIRDAVAGSNPVTRFAIGPAVSVAAAVYTVPVETAKAGWTGLQDAIDTTPAKTGIMEGAPRALQNAADFVGATAITGVIFGVMGLCGLHVGFADGATIALTLGALESSPGKQAFAGFAAGVRNAVVTGYTFAKDKLGNI